MSTTPPGAGPPSPVSKFFGVLFLAAGVLIMGLSGLCSAGFLVMAFAEPGGEFSGLGMIPLVGIIGGIPFALGVGAFLVGRLLFFGRRRPKTPPPDINTFN